MAIVDDSYLVGKIIEVNYTNSRALLLSDLNSKIPVLIRASLIFMQYYLEQEKIME
jgi:cell shape-determining protein MreC